MKKHKSAMFNGESLFLEYEDCCFDDIKTGKYFSYLDNIYFKIGDRAAISCDILNYIVCMDIIEFDSLAPCKKVYKYIY